MEEEASSENQYEHGTFPTTAFIGYITVSGLCLLFYTIAYCCTFCSSGKCDILKFGYKILLVLSWPIFSNSMHLIDACVGTAGYFKQEELPVHECLVFIVGACIIINMTLVNLFQLKIAGIAAIQRSKTKFQ